jgi:hypothetical protein
VIAGISQWETACQNTGSRRCRLGERKGGWVVRRGAENGQTKRVPSGAPICPRYDTDWVLHAMPDHHHVVQGPNGVRRRSRPAELGVYWISGLGLRGSPRVHRCLAELRRKPFGAPHATHVDALKYWVSLYCSRHPGSSTYERKRATKASNAGGRRAYGVILLLIQRSMAVSPDGLRLKLKTPSSTTSFERLIQHWDRS